MVSLRLAPEELELVQTQAQRFDMTVSAYLRTLLTRDIEGVRHTYPFPGIAMSSSLTYSAEIKAPSVTEDASRLSTYAGQR